MKQLILLLFFIPAIAYTQIPQPLPNTYVNDLAGVLNPDKIKSLNETIFSIEKKSSVQIAVILINDLPEKYEIEDYAREIGRKWHVGNAKNGIVYVAAINQHKQRLEIASELEGDIPDVVAKQITENLKPNFKAKDYFGGLQVLLNGLNDRIDPVIKEQKRLAEIEQEKKDKQTSDNVVTGLIWFLCIISIIGAIWFFVFRPIQKRKRKEREEAEAKERKERAAKSAAETIDFYSNFRRNAEIKSGIKKDVRPSTSVPPIVPLTSDDDDSYRRRNNSSNYSSSSSSSSSSDDSSYGNWGSGSSDSSSSSSDSGFSGGGSSDNW